MHVKKHHSWKLSYKDAAALQSKLAKKIILYDDFDVVKKIAGVDVKYIKNSNLIMCAVLVFSFPDLALIEVKTCKSRAVFPYIPGLLAFREGPIIEKCFKKIKNIPDLIIFDGHGYAHPRRLGIASHMGILLNLPAIGCAKKKLCGDYENNLKYRGEYSFLKENNEIIGAALVVKDNVKPAFVSQGNKISLDSAIKFILKVSKFKIPEPVRLAHNYLEEILNDKLSRFEWLLFRSEYRKTKDLENKLSKIAEADFIYSNNFVLD